MSARCAPPERRAPPAPEEGDGPSGRLLFWYDAVRRDLPWRSRPEPWAIWVAETMLQQTRVQTVVPYFERFLRRFPEPAALASAPVEAALALWSGLGYYRRCRQLHEGARQVVARGGEIPRSAAALERLPGVGPYTAAAIASIAFGEFVAVFDGNVARVMARLRAHAGAADTAAARRSLTAIATAHLDRRRPGDSNQALMELGATLCTPRAPRCDECPLAEGCQGRANGDPERYPAPRRRPATVSAVETVALVEAAGRFLFVRRPADAPHLGGLWELPTVAGDGASAEAALAAALGGRWRLGEERARVGHAITTRRITMTARAASWNAGALAEGRDAAWWAPDEARDRPLTGASRKVLERLLAARG